MQSRSAVWLPPSLDKSGDDDCSTARLASFASQETDAEDSNRTCSSLESLYDSEATTEAAFAEDLWARAVSSESQGSLCQYAQPDQTLIFLDWDNTLFPSSEFFDRMNLNPSVGFQNESALDAGLQNQLMNWRRALLGFLQEAMRLSSSVVICTNSKRPWVDKCIDMFAPDVKHLFGEDRCKVVYACEKLQQCRNQALRPVKYGPSRLAPSKCEHQELQTNAKYHAMRKEAVAFYNQYERQSWKNIIGFGDMPFERDALNEVAFSRVPVKEETLRTKVVVLPCNPTLAEITNNLIFSRALFSAFVHFDGDFELDLQRTENPLEVAAQTLNMPSLAHVSLPPGAWDDSIESPRKDDVHALGQVALVVHDAIAPREATFLNAPCTLPK